MNWILLVVVINTHGGGIQKIPFETLSACQSYADQANETLDIGQRYYAFCYDAKKEVRK